MEGEIYDYFPGDDLEFHIAAEVCVEARNPIWINMEDSINGGTPKWMVYKGTPMKMDDLGVPLF